MKQTINRTKTEAALIGTRSFSTRAVAVLLCCVMLLTAIGAGSVFSAFAVTRAQSTVTVTAAADDQQSDAEAVEAADPAPAADADNSAAAPAAAAVSKKGSDLASTGAKMDLAGTGRYGFSGNVYLIFTKDTAHTSGQVNGENVTASERGFLLGNYGNEGSTEVYLKTNTSGTTQHTYNVKFKNSNNDLVSLGNWTYYADSTSLKDYNGSMATNKDVDKISVAVQSNGYAKVFVKLWNEYNNNNRVEVKYTAVNNLTYSSLSAGSTSLDSGATTTLSSSGSGGSGDYTYTYTAKIKGTSTSVNCISGNTFTAPSVAASTTYVVTGTMKDNKCPDLTQKTKTVEITVGPKDKYYLWGGVQNEFPNAVKLATLTYNSTTQRYEGTYTFASTNWTSLLISNSSSSLDKVWTEYKQVGWSLDTYNNGVVVNNKNSSTRVPSSGEMSSGAFDYIEINDYSGYYGIKAGAKQANTTVTLAFDASTKVLYISDAEITSATIYAKDGAITASGKTYASIANTRIYAANGTTLKGTNTTDNDQQSYETYTAKKGETVVIKTTIGHNATGSNITGYAALRQKYYVRGFCVNGEVPELLTYQSSGVYTLTYQVPEDYDGGAIEITPIYYLVDTTTYPIVTFRVNGFTDNLKEIGSGKPNWGNTLYAYPFYGDLGGYNNAFGSYPGQPLIYNNGQYQIQIPQKSTAWERDTNTGSDGTANNKGKTLAQINATYVSGVTMSNGYYDKIHKTVMGYGDNNTSQDHVQTYDYDDFYKIFHEKEKVDNIVFDFKYKTKLDNRETLGSNASYTKTALLSTYGTNGNGFEQLKNYHGRAVDLFGTALSGDAADPDVTTPVYVIAIAGPNGSNGVANIAGYYATEWAVFANTSGSTYTRVTDGKSSIPPSVLILNDDDTTSFDTTTYPSAVSGNSITDWKALYTKLEAYRGKPVMITYESAQLQVGSTNYNKTGSDGATRNDGRWLYSSFGENISSNIRIDVSTDNGVNYYENGSASLGQTVSGLSAYFTNSEVAEGATTFATTIDPDKNFEFEAKTTNADYMFVGWYFDNGIKITENNTGSTERSGSYTLVARFMRVTSGQLVLQHTTATNATYSGSGNSKIAVEVTDDSDVTQATYAAADTITIPKKYITSTKTGYKIKVTLTSTPTGFDTYETTSLDTSDDVTTAKFFNSVATSTASGTTTKTFTFTVGDLFSGSDQIVNSLLYNSYYTKTVFSYEITFNYAGRKIASEAANRSYKRTAVLTPAQVTAYVTQSDSNYILSSDFITTLAPHESNFNETLFWTISDITSTSTTFTESFTAAVKTTGEDIRSTNRTARFDMGDGEPADDYNVTYGQMIKNGSSYITAADTNSSGAKFAYWKIETLDADPSKRTEVAKCYSKQFNYLAYDNYYITAIYDNSFTYGQEDISASINYLETSRNQWNFGGNGGYTISGQTARNQASDLLFNDFALAYSYNGNRLYENNDPIGGKAIQVGFIVEKIQKMDIKQDGTYDTTVSKYIATGNDAATAKANAAVAVSAITTGGFTAKAGTDDYAKYTKYSLDRTKLDNKNRIEFFYALYNAYGQNDDGTFASKLANKNYVYRAYSYIIVDGAVTVTDNPAYFIMYDEATK